VSGRLRADFNGLFGELLCLSHGDTALDEDGVVVVLKEGMRVTAYDLNEEDGQRNDLVASGVVEKSPDWLQCAGSRWVLRIDRPGVRHQSDMVGEQS
jgi:hypothetical protein